MKKELGIVLFALMIAVGVTGVATALGPNGNFDGVKKCKPVWHPPVKCEPVKKCDPKKEAPKKCEPVKKPVCPPKCEPVKKPVCPPK
ncbi:MAG: hypothetical protein QMD61_08210, partial [Methanobacterium sp.]|nr:hypothetical protein [Methanobacterium sp.]